MKKETSNGSGNDDANRLLAEVNKSPLCRNSNFNQDSNIGRVYIKTWPRYMLSQRNSKYNDIGRLKVNDENDSPCKH